VRRPYAGLLMLVVLYFFRPDLWGAEVYVRPVLWLTIAVAIGWWRQRSSERPSPSLRWLLVMIVLYAVSTLMTVVSGGPGRAAVSQGGGTPVALRDSSGTLIDIAKIFVVVFLITELCDTPKKLAGLMAAILAGSLWFVKVAVMSWAAVDFSDRVRIDSAVGQGGGANYIAWVLATTVPLLIYKLIRGRSWQRLVAGVMLPLWLAGIVSTGSRGGFACLAAALAVMLLVTRQFRVLLLVGVMGVLFLQLAPAGYIERLRTITLDPGKMDESMLNRYRHTKVGLRIMADHPLFGTGLDSFPEVKKKYMPQYSADNRLVAHNTLIQMGSEVGLIFLAAFLSFNVYAASCLWKRPGEAFSETDAAHMDWVRAWAAAALAATAAQMLKGDMAKVDYFWWLYGISIAYQAVRQRAAVAAAKAPKPSAAPARKRRRPPWAKAKLQPGT